MNNLKFLDQTPTYPIFWEYLKMYINSSFSKEGISKFLYECSVNFIVNTPFLYIFWGLLKVCLCSWIKYYNRNWPARKLTNHATKTYLNSIGIQYSFCKYVNHVFNGGSPYKYGARKWTDRKVTNHTSKLYLGSIGIYELSCKGDNHMFH